MVFALGFLTAGMLSLLFLPMFWRRAMRLSARRLELQMPLSMTEIVAEHDQLRAEFAAERRKLEQKSEKLAASLAAGRVELGQRMNRIAALEDSLAAVEQEEAQARELIAKFERQMSELELERAAFDKAHYDASGLLERRTAELADLNKKHEALGDLSDERRMTIAGLETQLAGLQMQFQSSQKNLQETRKALAEKISQVQYLERERDQFRADAVSARERREALQGNIAAQQQLVEKLDGELRTGRRERARLADEIAYLEQSLEQADAARARLKNDLRKQAQALEQSRQALAERSEAQKAGQAVLQGALDAARRDNQALRAELSEFRRKYPMEVAGAAIQSGKLAGNLAAGSIPGLVQASAPGHGTNGTVSPRAGIGANGSQDNALPAAPVQAVSSGERAANGSASQDVAGQHDAPAESELAALRESIAAFGADIIRAAAGAQPASRTSGSEAVEIPDAAARDLSEKVRKLEAMLRPAAAGR
jgi:predicted  nucleic acid-binding Zn-ribbon protein